MDSIKLYETMSGLTQQMVAAARAGNWDRLGELERDVAALRNQLSIADPVSKPLAPTEAQTRARKVELIQRMLADDREIRSYTEPWMSSVRRLLFGDARARNVRMAYQSPGN